MTAAGDLGQGPGETATAGAPAALVRWAEGGSGVLVMDSREGAMHVRNEKIPREAMLVGEAW